MDWRLPQPACTSPAPIPRTASWCTTWPATAKLPKNLPSLPRRRNWGWRLPQPACTSPTPLPPDSILVYDLAGNRQTSEEFTVATTQPQGLAVTASRVYVVSGTSPDGILVYDFSGNRQTSEEFAVATTNACWVGGYRLPRVRRQLHFTAEHPGVRLLRQPSNLRRIYRRYHWVRRGWRFGSSNLPPSKR